jgi:hypothetical protein
MLVKLFLSLLFIWMLPETLSANPRNSTKNLLEWDSLVRKEYTLHYTKADKDITIIIDDELQSGFKHIVDFFHHSFINKFDVYIFPARNLMDKQWQKDWGDSTFESQCWMIASGVGHRLDILSPTAWKKEACDHNANDSTEIRRVIWHELVHVFHGQYNPDHTFNYIEKLDWLVEGVATFVSGQLDAKRLQRIKQIIREGKAPLSLDSFWKGPEKYGLSGSMIAYIHNKYSRNKLFELLKQTNKGAALKSLDISETQLLADWKNSFQ